MNKDVETQSCRSGERRDKKVDGGKSDVTSRVEEESEDSDDEMGESYVSLTYICWDAHNPLRKDESDRKNEKEEAGVSTEMKHQDLNLTEASYEDNDIESGNSIREDDSHRDDHQEEAGDEPQIPEVSIEETAFESKDACEILSIEQKDCERIEMK